MCPLLGYDLSEPRRICSVGAAHFKDIEPSVFVSENETCTPHGGYPAEPLKRQRACGRRDGFNFATRSSNISRDALPSRTAFVQQTL